MGRRWRLALSLLLGAAVLTGCAARERATSTIVAAPAVRASCAAEAEQLTAPAAVRVEPAPAATLMAELGGGWFVYRCERRGGWLAIMFPAAGEPVDCAERSAAPACAIGWVKGDVETVFYG